MPRILHITGKCSDCFNATLSDSIERKEHDGYIPRGLGIGGSDYIELSINLDTGQIVGWEVPDQSVIEEVFPHQT